MQRRSAMTTRATGGVASARSTPQVTAGSADRGRPGDRPAFVGRDDAMGRVVASLREPSVVFVEGEAGIGKTRLVRESLAAVSERRILLAACAPWRDPFPLGPVVVGVRRLWQRVGSVELSPLGGALRPLFPEWADHLPPAPEPLAGPQETRHRLLCALTELVERLGVDALVVEDAHWADSATLEWLLMLAAHEWASSGLSVVVTLRPAEVAEDSLLRSVMARAGVGVRRERVELTPLDVAATRQLVGSMLRTDDVSAEFATFLRDHAGGIPLAVEETVRLLRDRRDIVRQHGTWTRRVLEDLEVPPAVRDSVLERVTRLDPDAQRVLHAAAVIADPADEELLAAVADLDEGAGRRGVSAALVSGLLRENAPRVYGFRHVLDAQAIESSIPVSERRRLHHRAAVTLRSRHHPSAARLARHFREAGDTEAWAEYAETAADLALDAGDDHTAVATLLDVLEAAEHPPERRIRLARKLANAAVLGAAALGELTPHIATVLRAVLDADIDMTDRGELRESLAQMLWAAGEGQTAFEEAEAAIADLGHRPDLAIQAMINISLPLIPAWPASRHLMWLERATEMADRLGSASEQHDLNRAQATTLLLLGDEAGWTLAARVADRLPAGPLEQRRVASSLLAMAEATLAWGRYGGTRRLLDAALDYVESAEYQRRQSLGRLVTAYLDWNTGRWDGLRTAAMAITDSRDSELRDHLQAKQLVGLLDLASGSRSEAERRLRDVAEEFARRHRVEPQDLAVPAALARLHLADGSPELALGETGPAVELVRRKGVWLWAGEVGPVHMEALVAAGEPDQAADLLRDFAAGIEGRNAPAPMAALATCRAILAEAGGDRNAGVELFAAAAEAWAALPRPYDELLTRERQGRCLLALGEHERALTVLADSQRRLHQLGARWDADRIAQVLRHHGADVPRTHRRGPRGYGDQLSPREVDVIELVAEGMTNKQIGEQLFLSPKTVDRHLSSAKRKLGATTRVGAAMAAAEAGFIGPDVETTAG